MRIKKKETAKKGTVAININVIGRKGGRGHRSSERTTTYGFDVFISTGPTAARRIQNPDKEGNEEVEVSRRQLRKLHRQWGIFFFSLPRHTRTKRQQLGHLHLI